MEVSREAVVSMLQEIGYKNAKKYDDDKLMARIQELPDNVPDEIPDDHRDLFESLVEAVKDEDDIELTDDEEESVETNGKSKKKAKKASDEKASKAGKSKKASSKDDPDLVPISSKKSGKGKKGKKGKAAKASGNGKVERDKYGAGVTTQSAAINKVFSKKAKDVNTIAKESGIDNIGRVRAHVYHMVKEGHVKKTDKGYALAE